MYIKKTIIFIITFIYYSSKISVFFYCYLISINNKKFYCKDSIKKKIKKNLILK